MRARFNRCDCFVRLAGSANLKRLSKARVAHATQRLLLCARYNVNSLPSFVKKQTNNKRALKRSIFTVVDLAKHSQHT